MFYKNGDVSNAGNPFDTLVKLKMAADFSVVGNRVVAAAETWSAIFAATICPARTDDLLILSFA